MSLHGVSYKWLAIKRRVIGYRLRARLMRLWKHLGNFRKNHSDDISATIFVKQPAAYLLEFIFFLLDLFAIGELYETFGEWVKFTTRALNAREREIVQQIFGKSIDVDRIRVDEFALLTRHAKIAYVGVYTINYFGKMSEDLFVHELIHIWQYEYRGSVYIPRALRAQRSQAGYNYGGVEKLQNSGLSNLLAYNYEQQGDILADYWRTKHNRPTKWNNQDKLMMPYLKLVEQLHSDKSDIA